MQASCSHCGTQHVLKDTEIAVHNKVQFHCSKCGRPTVVEINIRPDRTVVMSPLPNFARAGAGASHLNLPATGSTSLDDFVAKLKKPRVILGRDDADIALDDQEISRHHCLLEVRESFANLKDLDSTNGTFFDEERVRAAMLQNGAEFRIGTSVIRISFQ